MSVDTILANCRHARDKLWESHMVSASATGSTRRQRIVALKRLLTYASVEASKLHMRIPAELLHAVIWDLEGSLHEMASRSTKRTIDKPSWSMTRRDHAATSGRRKALRRRGLLR